MKNKIFILTTALIALFCVGAGYWYFFPSSTVSTVKVTDGVAKIFLNGREFKAVVAQAYNQTLKYDAKWAAQLKKTIDAEKTMGANLFLFHLWWSDLDKSTSRPNHLGDNLDFTYVDEVMDYADRKGMKIMLLTGMHAFIPEWWKEENGFSAFPPSTSGICMPKEIGTEQTCIPKELCSAEEKNCCSQDTARLICCDVARGEADMTTTPPNPPKPINNITDDVNIFKCSNIDEGASYTACSACETDNYGWKYNNLSIGYDKARTDYSEYLTAIINRYKNHQALLGWQMQLGYSGEDYYGPNVIALQGLSSTLYVGDTGLMNGKMTDYSKVFQESFKSWLTEKYKTTANLQNAWQDTNVTLENFKIPVSDQFFTAGKTVRPFPDEGLLNFFVTLDDLTNKGKDFYEFREYMKTKDSQHYSHLFKSLDPNHVLFFNAYDNINEYQDKNINGYFLNNRLNAEKKEENYLQALFYAILASKYGQLSLPAWENIGGVFNEDQAQLKVMEEAGKALKCFGYGFGYVSDIGTDMPSWRSDQAKQIIKKIIAYSPTKDCKCEIVNRPDTLKTKTMKQLLAMYNITDYDYCNNFSDKNESANTKTPQPTPSSNDDCMPRCVTAGKTPEACLSECKTETSAGRKYCGDGICDGPETTSLCPQDCK